MARIKFEIKFRGRLINTMKTKGKLRESYDSYTSKSAPTPVKHLFQDLPLKTHTAVVAIIILLVPTEYLEEAKVSFSCSNATISF